MSSLKAAVDSINTRINPRYRLVYRKLPPDEYRYLFTMSNQYESVSLEVEIPFTMNAKEFLKFINEVTQRLWLELSGESFKYERELNAQHDRHT